MADANSTQQTQQRNAVQILGMPAITIPRKFEQTNFGFPTFDIRTPKGVVRVVARIDTFCCNGPMAALEAAGLLQAAWLPGVPGNNKTSQTVIFENGGHVLLVGKRGFRADLPRITITRKSHGVYEVNLPPTEKQADFIVDMITKYEANERAIAQNEKKSAYDYETETPTQFTETFRFVVIALETVMEGRKRPSSRFRYDDETIAKMGQAYTILLNALAQAKILPRNEGNVIYLDGQKACQASRSIDT